MTCTTNSILKTGSKTLFTSILLTSVLMFTGCSDDSDSFQDSVGDSMDEMGESMDNMGNMDMMPDNANEVTLTADLAGRAETNAEGSGSASVTVNRESGEVCYEIEVDNIEDATMAHIHSGAEGESGGVVVNFNMPENGMDGCVSNTDQEVLDAILQTPANYYVNVHNQPFPGGVIRGQLSSETD